MLKIPFGKHKETGRFYDAGSVQNGLKCNCICKECEGALEAVHPKLPNRQNYFRHAINSNCKGGLETVFHLVAKQILKENISLHLTEGNYFSYNYCDIETTRHGKRPDAFIGNDTENLIVEIFFWHQIDQSTLDIYIEKGEKVLEIDISSERRSLFDYEYLKDLILHRAPRKLYSNANLASKSHSSKDNSWLWASLTFVVAILLFWRFKKNKGRRRKRRYK